VFDQFGFHGIFSSWILLILKYVFLSGRVNDNLVGYFSYRRGVEQGDFFISFIILPPEEVLSRWISQLFPAKGCCLWLVLKGFFFVSSTLC